MNPARLWPVALVGVLAVTVAANVTLLIAARDPHASAVESDYYDKAVAWDSTQAVRRRSDALGWRLEARIAPVSRRAARVEVRLEDRRGAPIDRARLEVEAIHDCEPDRPVRGELRFVGDGRYAAALPLDRAGLWELRLDADRGSDRFLASVRREAPWSSPPR